MEGGRRGEKEKEGGSSVQGLVGAKQKWDVN